MKYYQEKQAFSHYMRWAFFFFHVQFFIKKKRSLPFETTAFIAVTVGSYLHNPKENVGKKLTSS